MLRYFTGYFDLQVALHQKSLGFILWGAWMSVPNFNPMFIQIIQSGPKFCGTAISKAPLLMLLTIWRRNTGNILEVKLLDWISAASAASVWRYKWVKKALKHWLHGSHMKCHQDAEHVQQHSQHFCFYLISESTFELRLSPSITACNVAIQRKQQI